MNKKTFTNLSIFAAAATLLSSCALDPNYRAYQQQQATSAVTNTATNAVTAANPYGVPQSSGEIGTYTPTGSTSSGDVPYQPLPGVSQPSQPSQATQSSYTPAPTYVQPVSQPSLIGSTHQVVAGDTLWDLSKKFGSTVEAIQAANGLTTSVIRTGQTLVIPGR